MSEPNKSVTDILTVPSTAVVPSQSDNLSLPEPQPFPQAPADPSAADRTKFESKVWASHGAFILASLGACVGYGNVWRFAFMTHRYGGGVFLVLYTVLLVFVGIPVFMLETAWGQFMRSGPSKAYNVVPICRGVGWVSVFNSFYIASYYVMFLVYSSKYLSASFATNLPWNDCESVWSAGLDSANCWHSTALNNNLTSLPHCRKGQKAGQKAGPNCTKWRAPAEYYWCKVVLGKDENYGLANLGSPQPMLIILLVVSWVLICLCLIRGVLSLGKVVYFTVIFQYFILVILCGFTMSQKGAWKGIEFMLIPKWTEFWNPETWGHALSQLFYSIGTGAGGLTLYGSYNKINNRIQRDAVIVVLGDFSASLLASGSIFAMLGVLATKLDIEIGDVTDENFAMLFHILPQTLLLMEYSEVWTVFYFSMLYAVGLDSAFCDVITVHQSIIDQFPSLAKYETIVLVALCSLFTLIGVAYTTRGGIDLVVLVDNFVTDAGLSLAVMAELVVLIYVFGISNVCDAMEFMVGESLNLYWKFCWFFVDPILTVVLFGVCMATYAGFKTEPKYPDWALPLGWLIFLSVALQIPFWAIYTAIQFWLSKRSLYELITPAEDWGPTDEHLKIEFLEWKVEKYRPAVVSPPSQIPVQGRNFKHVFSFPFWFPKIRRPYNPSESSSMA